MTDTLRFKLFPRNLTARASAMVLGNSPDTRPESGVENCFPGLEFDQRNLDKRFFAGLTFELHHSEAVMVREISASSPAAQVFQQSDIEDGGVFLSFVQGLFSSRSSSSPAPRIVSMFPPAGLDAWRRIRDLERGRVGVLIADSVAVNWMKRSEFDPDDAFKAGTDGPVVVGEGRALLLFGDRARFVDEQGVIPETVASPGELTQSLCSPWQYDFADCGCFYWASNKPDLVSSEHQSEQVLNFQRKDRSPAADRAAAPEDWVMKQRGAWDSRDVTLDHTGTMARWMDLPFVIGRRETDRYVPSSSQPLAKILTRAQIIERFKKLAAVEHALAIEYLYAHYSFGLPHARPEGLSADKMRAFAAAQEIFQVAVDEMRHLRTVNEILAALNEPAILDRALVIGEDFDGPGTGFNRAFELAPCTGGQLGWFIDVEKASQNTDDQSTIDGMYTLILRNVLEGGAFSETEKSSIAASIKVIIDEGVDHYRRFTSAQLFLEGLPETAYLRVTETPPVLRPIGSAERILQDVTDAAYLVVLRSLDFVFKLGDLQRGAMLESARRAMYNMDDAARSLASSGIGAMFDHTRMGEIDAEGAGAGPAPPDPEAEVARVGRPLEVPLQALRAQGGQALADRMEGRLQKMLEEFSSATRP